MKAISTTEARKHISDLVDRVVDKNEHVVLERHGKKVAAIIPLEELGLLEALLRAAKKKAGAGKGKKGSLVEQIRADLKL